MATTYEFTLVAGDIAHGLSRHVVQLFQEHEIDHWCAYDVPVLGVSVRMAIGGGGGNRRWHANWYADIDGAQALIAGGSTAPGRDSGTIDLCDVEGYDTPLGRLQITRTGTAPSPSQSNNAVVVDATANANADAKRLISRVFAVSRRLHAATSDMFADARLMVDRVRAMPMLVYALHANDTTATTGGGTDASIAQLFAHLLSLAEHFVCAPAQTSDACALADMLTLVTLGWRYRFDVTYDDAHTPTDRWTSLWSFPHVARAVFDCEDGAHACMELLLAFTRCNLPRGTPPRLVRIQTLARAYTPYIAIGELKVHDAFEAHCMLVLLDDDDAAAGHHLPSITIEPTAFASGAWHDRMLDSLAVDTATHAAAQHTADTHRVDDESTRVRMPLSMVRDQRMYGRMIALMTCSGANKRAQHILLHSGDAGAGIGVDACAFLLAPGRCKRELAIDIPLDRMRAMFAHELAQMPRSRMPRAPPATTRSLPLPRIRKGGLLVAMSEHDADVRDGSVCTVFEGVRLAYIS